MDMDAMEELKGSTDRAMIVKGRRSKRPRQSSPAFSAVVASSDDGGGGGEDGGGGEINSLIPSISTCSDQISTSTEEDEDMANCLILLAQSGCQRQVDEEEVKMEKISSRKFTEMATTTTAKAGIYVYECKTCNRTFPSFQALGGHRASHKKPKQIVEEKKAPITSSKDHHEEKQQEEKQFTKLSPSLSCSQGVNKAKIHECSICGLEFSSGQALGGHMRRHRTPTSSTKVTMSIDTTTTESSHDGERPRNILQLDLNLPAPEDDHHDSKFQFSASQKHLFSSPALVDCHY